METRTAYTGVDYLRLTATDHKPLAAWHAIVLPEFVREEKAGRKAHQRWVLGYFGRAAEHCFLGENDSGCMLQLSGTMAWDRWYDAGNHSERCTRIDLQVTYPVEDEPGLYLQEMYEVGKLAKSANGRKPELELRDTPYGAKMLTVGSRQSLLYGRMYDKYRESKMPEYKGCVRWEVEVKAEAARDLNAYMRDNRNEAGMTRAIVKDFWERRGMTPFWDTFEGMEARPPVKRSKTDETKIAWLAAQVRPTLTTLAEHGKLWEGVRALFDETVTDAQVSQMVEILSIV